MIRYDADYDQKAHRAQEHMAHIIAWQNIIEPNFISSKKNGLTRLWAGL